MTQLLPAPTTGPDPAARWTPGATVALGLGLCGAVALRVGVGGTAGVRDPWAGLAFAAALAILCACAGGPALTPRVRRYRRGAGSASEVAGPEAGFGMQSRIGGVTAAGVGGAGVLCVVPLVVHLRTPGGALDPSGFGPWAVVVTAVAVAEEAFLRGALWTAVARVRGGQTAALLVTTVAFALLHVPFYGPDALPLDLAVGLLLGGLRQLTGGWAAPAVAHTLADLAGWWLR